MCITAVRNVIPILLPQGGYVLLSTDSQKAFISYQSIIAALNCIAVFESSFIGAQLIARIVLLLTLTGIILTTELGGSGHTDHGVGWGIGILSLLGFEFVIRG